MASINIRVDENLKKQAYVELERLGITPSDFIRQTLKYVADKGQLPFVSSGDETEDAALLDTLRERLANPQRVRVSLDDL